MSEIIAKIDYAKRRGVTASAVTNWIKRGKLTPPALTEDGRILVAVADRQLGINLDVAKAEGARALNAVRRRRAAKGDGALTLREQILTIDLELRRRKLSAERGVYVRADGVAAEWTRQLSAIFVALDAWVQQLPVELGIGAQDALLIKASWRRFRQRESDATQAEAAALPTFDL